MKYFAFTITCTALALFTWPLFSQAATLDQIRLSWQSDPRATMTVMWRTQENQTAPKVQYGTTTAYGREATGTSQAAVLDGYFYHTVELTTLTPNTLYHYRVSGEAGAWSGDSTFRTAPDGAADFTFTAFADNGINANATRFAEPIKDLVAAQNPVFHLISGDLTYADGDRCDGQPCMKEHWEQWFTEMSRISAKAPVMPALGNHERSGDVKFPSGELFYTRSFALPTQNREEYYSFDYGDIHFVALNSDDESSLRAGQSQYEWLRADLAATTKRWKIVYLHHMVYASTSGHSVRERTQTNLSPLFDQYDVDLVIQGHNHNYERTLPVRFGAYQNPVIATTERTNYVSPDGTIYVTTGGAGQGLASFSGTQAAWSVVQCRCHQILRVDVDDAGVLTIRSIGADGTTIVDQFTISKTGAVATPPPIATTPAPSPQSSPLRAGGPPGPEAPRGEETPPISPPSQGGERRGPGDGQGEGVPNVQSIRGFNLAVWSRDALGRSDARESIDALKTTGANYVAFAPFWYQDRRTSSAIYRRDSKTATDDSLRTAIRYAKSIGLKVALKPMVDSRDNTWRGNFEPSDPNAWFQSYRDMMLTYARIAQDEGVDYLIVGTEFTKLTKPPYTAKWRELIAAVRQVYRGPLTYAANWGKTHEGEYYQVEFWDALDSIGIDAYFPVATDGNPTVASVESAWTAINSGGTLSVPNSHAERGGQQNWLTDIRALHERFNKPVIFTEMGYLSCDSAGVRPWEYPCGRSVDLQEQATLYEGTMKFWADKDWMQGFLWWRWDVDPDKGGPSNGDYLVQNKPPTLDVLRRFWLAAAPSPPQSSPTSHPLLTSPIKGEEPSGSSPPLVGGAEGGGTPLLPTSSAGGGGIGLITSTPSTAPTFPTSPSRPSITSLSIPNNLITQSLNNPRPFAYGQPRLPLWQERVRSWQELAVPLRQHFRGAIPLHKKQWPTYINAYLYGGYPKEVIARAIRLGGKVVHPSIPWTAWRRSPDYRRYVGA